MEERPADNSKRKRRYQRWTPEIDSILKSRYGDGDERTDRTESISEIERLTGLSREAIRKRASREGYARKSRPWSAADTESALELSTEKPAAVIARYLRRTQHSVECKLSRLKRTTKFSEGYTRRELAEYLCRSSAAIRRFLAENKLKIIPDRLPNQDRGDVKLDPSTASLPIRKAEKTLGKRYGRISEESLRHFLRKYPNEIPYSRLKPDTLDWLDRLGFKPSDNPELSGRSKQVDHIYKCPWCGRRTAGNGHFRHVKSCARNSESLRAKSRRP